MIAFLDLETYSPVPIANGTHAYAEQAEVMLFAYAFDDGPVHCWDVTTGEPMPAPLAQALADPSVLTVWHNGGMFDRVVLQHAMGIDLPTERIHDTMVQALCHSLPGSLDKLGEVMGLEMRKDKRGGQLIQMFCKPRPKNMKLRRATRETHPREWAEFVEYAKADIPPMRELYRKLPRWNYSGAELDLWRLDQTINMRGVAVDLDLARAAIRASGRAQKALAERTQELTAGAVTAATQRSRLMEHIASEFGLQMDDLRGSTVERVLEHADNMPPELRELLHTRLQSSKTSVAKYERVINYTSRDGRLRGITQFCGAGRTGRWAGRGPQFQNMSRPSIGNLQDDELQCEVDFGITAMLADCEDFVALHVASVQQYIMELCSSAIRGCIVAPPGKKLNVADLSNIEGRKLAWHAGEKWKLQAFRDYDAGTGFDLYKLAYAKAFGVRPEDVTKAMRQIGKVMELALGYQGGVGAFITFAAAYGIDLEAMAANAIGSIPAETLAQARDFMEWLYGQDKKTNPQHWLDQGASLARANAEAEIHRKAARYGLSEEAFIVCDSFKRLWREAHPETVSWWREVEDAARSAIQNPGSVYQARRVKFVRTGAWLRCILPSGRQLCYPSPKLDEDSGQITYMGVNQYSRKWERIKTYAGKLVENIVQASARDVLAHGMVGAEAAGYLVVLSIHDELITETPDTDEYTAEGLASIMASVPPWAQGLPLAAEGFEDYRYHK